MDRPVNPEPGERSKIKRAFKVARITSGWGGWFLGRLVPFIAIVVGIGSRWYFGVALFVVLFSIVLAIRQLSRCPRCGLVWSSRELESFVCSGCRLNIGLGLRE